MDSSKKFFDWAFQTRARNVIDMYNGVEMSPERMFLNFCSHEPAFVSHGPAGLNASVKGVGFLPKDEYLEEILEIYINHIKTYEPGDKTYGHRGLELLIKHMYGDEAHDKIDFTKLGSLEMAKRHSWTNYQVNSEAALIFHQPPMISYKLKGRVEIYDENLSGKRELYQQFINAQHDMYHTPDMSRWLSYPAYIFRIEEVYDNSASKNGFGRQLEYPAPDMTSAED
ncbi:MAG: hypothetical protein Q4E13_01995 [Clostridia bacterium]|nr:hypothetical protein [Clostridia bacterium]